jgi:hypothetical protein
MDDPRFVFWHSFEPGVASFGLAGVITEIGLAVSGADFAALQPDDRRRGGSEPAGSAPAAADLGQLLDRPVHVRSWRGDATPG